MKTIRIQVSDCRDCPYHAHDGLLQNNPHWCCTQVIKNGRSRIICSTSKTPEVPAWCPHEIKDFSIERIQ